MFSLILFIAIVKITIHLEVKVLDQKNLILTIEQTMDHLFHLTKIMMGKQTIV